MRKWLLKAVYVIVVIVLTPIELTASTISVFWKLIGAIVLELTGNKMILATWADIWQLTIDKFNSALEKL